MTQTAVELESTFQRAWTLLTSNPIVVVPGLVLAGISLVILGVVLTFAFGGIVVAGATGSSTIGLATVGAAVVAGVVLLVLAGIVQTAFVTAMAGDAWQSGTARFAAGWSALSARLGDIVVAVLLLCLLGLAAVLLAPLTLTLSIWAYVVFFLYAMPAVIIGGHSATDAIAESGRIAARNFWPTVGVAAIVICASLVAAGLGSEIARIQPVIGSISAIVLQQAGVAYGTLVIVGEYFKLHPAELPPAPMAGPAAQA